MKQRRKFKLRKKLFCVDCDAQYLGPVCECGCKEFRFKTISVPVEATRLNLDASSDA